MSLRRFAATLCCLAALVLILTAVPASAQEADPVPAADTDGDELTDELKLELGTDPSNPDTDEDGINDGDEFAAGTDSREPDSRPDDQVELDGDGDGLMDEEELQIGTDPANADSDSDGFDDGVEVDAGTDPLDPSSTPPGGTGGSLGVFAWECPGPHPTDSDEYSAYEDCNELVDGYVFHLIDPSGADRSATTADGGTALWHDVFPGRHILAEQGLPGYGAPVVFCGSATEDPQRYPVIAAQIGHTITLDVLIPDTTYTCSWFNIPLAEEPTPPAGEVAEVTVYATACPRGYTGNDFFADCYGNPQAGIGFGLSLPGAHGGDARTTGPDGFVTLGVGLGLADSSIDLQENVTAGFAVDFFVYCTKEDGATVLEVEQTVRTAGGNTYFFASFDAAPGDQIRCDWYNIPPAEEPPDPVAGSLTVYATSCPPGYTGTDYFEDCYGNPEVDLGFAASGRIGVIAEAATDADGFVTYSFADLGVHEPPDAGEGEAGISIGINATEDFAVYCSKNGGQAVEVHALVDGGPAGLPGVGLNGEDVEPGDEIRCDWYLLPAGPEPPAPTPTQPATRLPNTGAGAAKGEAEETADSKTLTMILAGALALAGAVAIGRRRLA